MQNLGAVERVIKPYAPHYFKKVAVGATGIAAVVVFGGVLAQYTYGGIPATTLVPVLAVAILSLAVFNYFRAKNSAETIELCEKGIVIGSFFAAYAALNIKYKRGILGVYYVFESEMGRKKFNYAIAADELKFIGNKSSHH